MDKLRGAGTGQPGDPASHSGGLWPHTSFTPVVNWGLFLPLGLLVPHGGLCHLPADGLEGPGYPLRSSAKVTGQREGATQIQGSYPLPPPVPCPLSPAPLLSMQGLSPTPQPWDRVSAHGSSSEALEVRGHGGH